MSFDYTVRPISDRTAFLGEPGSNDRMLLTRSSWESTQKLMGRELRELGASNVVVEVDVRERDITVGGQLRANATVARTTPAVRIAFESHQGALVYATDAFGWDYYDRPRAQGWQENVRAIALGLEALRKVDRYGISRRGEQYRGYLAIESGHTPTGMSADIALQVILTETGGNTAVDQLDYDLSRCVKTARARAHPDLHHGDQSRWNAVEQAVKALTAAGKL